MPDQVAIFKDGKPLSEKLALSLELVERMQKWDRTPDVDLKGRNNGGLRGRNGSPQERRGN